MNTQIHVALASDQNFLPGLRVAAASIACFAAPADILVFHIIDGGIQSEDFWEIQDILRRINPGCVVQRHVLKASDLADYPLYGGSRLTYARLLLPEILVDVDHVIYCDCDFMWFANIADLWRLRDDAVIFQSTIDGYQPAIERERRWFAENGYAFDESRYFCAGLSLFNLKLFREEGISKAAFDFLLKHQNTNCADQTALNVLLQSRVRILPRMWQRFSRQVSATEMLAPVVLHYANDIPWRREGWWNLLTDPIVLWHRFNDLLIGVSGGSLAMSFTLSDIIGKRTLDRLLQVRIVRWMFYRALEATGRRSYIKNFEECSRDLQIGRVILPEMPFGRN